MLKMTEMLTILQEKLRENNNRSLAGIDEEDDDGETIIIESTSGQLHNRHLVVLEGDPEEAETDHIMLFGDTGKDSRDILSIKSFEGLMFLTQFFQLVIDFYFGFYMVPTPGNL